MELQATQVNLTGLLEVLGSNLYSSPDVVLRELIQNAHDSCTRRQLEDDKPFEASIFITTSEAERSITITDTGAGLTESEISAYLATIGTGYTGKLRRENASSALIGAFGLGFLSSYVVADRVEFWTASYQSPTLAHRFVSNGGERYSIAGAAKRAVGSSVRLELKKEFGHLADAAAVGATLKRYCALLDIPVFLNTDTQPVNRLEPPWRHDHAPGTASYRRLADTTVDYFEERFGALATLPVTPTDQLSSRGMLWLHDRTSYATSDNRNLWVFVRGMLISDSERELLPPWAGFVGGVIESDTLVPTASRESLKEDDQYMATAQQVTEALINGLAALPSLDRDRWRTVSERHNEALLGAALADERLFEALADELLLPTTEGELGVSVISQRSSGKIHITSGAERGPEELIFRALRIPIVLGERFGALAFAKRYAERQGLEALVLGTEEGNRRVFQPSTLTESQNTELIDLFAGDNQVRPVAFAPKHIPLIVLLDRDALVKQRLESESASTRIAPAALQLARMHTGSKQARSPRELFVNTSSPLILHLLTLELDAQRRLAPLLKAFANCTAATEQDDDNFKLDEQLALFNDNLLGLLGASG